MPRRLSRRLGNHFLQWPRNNADLFTRTIGRPPIDRERAFDALLRLPSARRHMRNVSARNLATTLGHDRGTVAAMLDDLEAAGRIRRRRRKGRSGVLVEILDDR